MTYPVISQTKILLDNWSFRNVNEDHWHMANVPGSVFNELYTLGIMPDPFWGQNELSIRN